VKIRIAKIKIRSERKENLFKEVWTNEQFNRSRAKVCALAD